VYTYFAQYAYVHGLGRALSFSAVPLTDAVAQAREWMDKGGFTALFARQSDLELAVSPWQEAWKSHPVVSVSGPKKANCLIPPDHTPHTFCHFEVSFAHERIREGRVETHDASLGDEFFLWMKDRFVSRKTADSIHFLNPGEAVLLDQWANRGR
jgi:hypothetical protein